VVACCCAAAAHGGDRWGPVRNRDHGKGMQATASGSAMPWNRIWHSATSYVGGGVCSTSTYSCPVVHCRLHRPDERERGKGEATVADRERAPPYRAICCRS